VKTRDEIDALKLNWRADPCWNIEDTEGFEDHRTELVAYRDEMVLKWMGQKAQRDENERLRLKRKAESLNCSPELLKYIESIEYRLSELQGDTQ